MTPKDESDLRAALEPCPHCGVPLFIRDSVNAYGRCETEGCWMYERKLTVQLDDPRQIEQWNTRATPPSDHIASPSGDMVLIERARLQRLADRLNAAGVIRISNSGAVHEIAAMLQDATPSPAQQSGEAKKDYRLNLAKALFEATYDGNLQIWSDATRDYWLGRADTAIASHGAQQSGELREAGDTVAFVQHWLMSGDYDPTQWDRDFAAAIDARAQAGARQVLERIVKLTENEPDEHPASVALRLIPIRQAAQGYLASTTPPQSREWPADAEFQFGQRVTTPRKPFWEGIVCGWYRNAEGRLGFNVEATAIPGAIHNYPQSGLRLASTEAPVSSPVVGG